MLLSINIRNLNKVFIFFILMVLFFILLNFLYPLDNFTTSTDSNIIELNPENKFIEGCIYL
ncbi:MAG: hypothetical protein CFH01_01702 [Alphaproteobacteria bacterium MarineAlpha2_Bin1]|nr:MAG: hypothetical protein CFH01_01702 [Alphaproteobacteria bacterium MarineAlpha2_Bin1]